MGLMSHSINARVKDSGHNFSSRKLCKPRECRQIRQSRTQTRALFGWGTKEERAAERDEQYQQQLDILKRRRTNTWQQSVVERRKEVKRYNNDKEYRKKVDAEKRERFKKQQKEDPKRGIIIPLAPFGMPEYDGGERFDLRLPYVDNGWVDEDAEFGKQVARFFGFGRKKKDEGEKGSQGK